ncbi:hypothetical protein HJO_09394 [Hyphomonas johnsonii MHS-2]|uniref:Uncharacterized protein n=1 Tax=Hyphomonas johnsonii MHS-2 TaxID=1280950 RepID=A0A059FNL4_9PROT|nr:hypothetical protein HJO_09394 [Hyphomonas johnsonii MHS-2]
MIAPTARSESIASCLPGMASSANRAPTSAMRPAPLVMTMKFTITSTLKTTSPTNRFPPMMNMAKPSMTLPAACVPVWPSPMISFVEETLSASRRIRDASRTLGKEEKSSGRSINTAVAKIRIAKANDSVRPISITHDGTGRIITRMTTMRPMASKEVGRARPKEFDDCTGDLSGNERQYRIVEQVDADPGHVSEREKEHDHDHQHFGDEGERDFLDRREGLQQADGEANDQRAGEDRHRHHGCAPYVGAQDFEDFGLRHHALPDPRRAFAAIPDRLRRPCRGWSRRHPA